MGYNIRMLEGCFKMKKENFEDALKALKSIFVPENMTCFDETEEGIRPHFAWVTTEYVLASQTLDEALNHVSFCVKHDDNGDICNIDFTSYKYGDEEKFLRAIAPYVEDGSYLLFEGEDKATWRWVFNNGKLRKISQDSGESDLKNLNNLLMSIAIREGLL